MWKRWLHNCELANLQAFVDNWIRPSSGPGADQAIATAVSIVSFVQRQIRIKKWKVSLLHKFPIESLWFEPDLCRQSMSTTTATTTATTSSMIRTGNEVKIDVKHFFLTRRNDNLMKRWLLKKLCILWKVRKWERVTLRRWESKRLTMGKWDSGSQKSERARESDSEKVIFFKTRVFFQAGRQNICDLVNLSQKKFMTSQKSSCSSFPPFQLNAKTELDGIRRRYLLWTAFVTFDVFRDKVLLVLARWDWLGIFGIGRKSLFFQNNLANGG